jgi:hypothetical protein
MSMTIFSWRQPARVRPARTPRISIARAVAMLLLALGLSRPGATLAGRGAETEGAATAVACGAYEPNNTLSTMYGPLAPKTVLKALLCTGDDLDFYSFKAESSRDLVITLTLPATLVNHVSLWVYKGDGSPLYGTDKVTSASSTLRYTLPASGKYIVGLYTPDATLDAAQPYTLKLSYRPISATWAFTGQLRTARRVFTATRLPNGKVLVTGGLDATESMLASAELYDPATGKWSATGSMRTLRSRHTATLLESGKVLVVGGQGSGSVALTSAELYDPATGLWSTTGSLHHARYWHTATLLESGKVLAAAGIAGSAELETAELYDPATGLWSETGGLGTPRQVHTAVLLQSGKVLVAGGVTNGSSTILASVELYDPATGLWSNTGGLGTARYAQALALLPNGKVLVMGGNTITTASLVSAELYNPETGLWRETGSMSTGRMLPTATRLADGSVLVVGGYAGAALKSAELYFPAGN